MRLLSETDVLRIQVQRVQVSAIRSSKCKQGNSVQRCLVLQLERGQKGESLKVINVNYVFWVSIIWKEFAVFKKNSQCVFMTWNAQVLCGILTCYQHPRSVQWCWYMLVVDLTFLVKFLINLLRDELHKCTVSSPAVWVTQSPRRREKAEYN